MFNKLIELFFRGKFGNFTGFRGKILANRRVTITIDKKFILKPLIVKELLLSLLKD